MTMAILEDAFWVSFLGAMFFSLAAGVVGSRMLFSMIDAILSGGETEYGSGR
jgi:hypothetical protein